MYLPITSKGSCARAWVGAASAVASDGDAYNVIIDVDNPLSMDEIDDKVISLVDSFLRERDQNPITTVANTIFPQSLYDRFGAPAFYDEYLKVYDQLTSTKRWGRYFERIIRHQTLEGGTYRPLQNLIDKLREQTESGKCWKATHELAVYDPLLDSRYLRGGQCLSFLSFKHHPKRGLMLTAMYRNHAYVTRCLGNLIGLGRLQSFVANECDLDVGPLTCVSTHAEIDTGSTWGVRDARQLIAEAAEIIEEASDADQLHTGSTARATS